MYLTFQPSFPQPVVFPLG